MAKKPIVTTLQSGFNSTEVLNQNFEALRDAFDNTLSLDGSTPNAMEADLDLNGNNIIGATGLLINGTDYLADVEAAKAAALAAQAAAELAENNAETAEVNAEASETAAANSATSSASSASAASVSATAAQTAQTAAELAETNAETAETNAETAETNAQASALAALASEIAAAASEAGVDADRVAAQAAAAAAAASESAAATSETNAATSETNAATSASASASSATASAASATAASASEASVEADRLSAQAAATSASASEVAAAASESNAASSETAAASSASSASTSAFNAASSASSASASADAALAALDSFDDRYLGQKASDPTLDNDGNALVAGALYFNTTDEIMKVFDGSLWVAAYASLSGAMFGANNLSDVSSASDSRANLGLGTGNSPTFAALDVTGTVTADGLTVGNATDPVVKLLREDATTGVGESIGDVQFWTTDTSGGGDTKVRAKIGSTVTSIYNAADLTFYTGTSGGGLASDILKRMQITGEGDISFYEDTGTTPKFFWDASAESLGLGATSFAGEALRMERSGDMIVGLFSGASNGTYLNMGTTSNRDIGQISYTQSTNHMSFRTNDAERMRIDSSGNVGIGTSSPISVLSSNGNITAVNYGKASLPRIILEPVDNGPQKISPYGTGVSAEQQLAFCSGVNADERMRIDASGNLLVGKTSDDGGATQGAEVKGNGFVNFTKSNDNVLNLNRLSSDGNIAVFRKDGSTVGSIAVDGGGAVIRNYWDVRSAASIGSGLGGNDGYIQPLNKSGTSDAQIDLGSSSSRFKDLYLSGTANAANFNTTSDATLKTNVETLTGSLDAVNALRGVSFDWIESGGSEVGFIAQEVEEVLPEVVSTNDQGIKSVKYGNMVAVLVEALKEQQLRIEALEAKLEG